MTIDYAALAHGLAVAARVAEGLRKVQDGAIPGHADRGRARELSRCTALEGLRCGALVASGAFRSAVAASGHAIAIVSDADSIWLGILADKWFTSRSFISMTGIQRAPETNIKTGRRCHVVPHVAEGDANAKLGHTLAIVHDTITVQALDLNVGVAAVQSSGNPCRRGSCRVWRTGGGAVAEARGRTVHRCEHGLAANEPALVAHWQPCPVHIAIGPA